MPSAHTSCAWPAESVPFGTARWLNSSSVKLHKLTGSDCRDSYAVHTSLLHWQHLYRSPHSKTAACIALHLSFPAHAASYSFRRSPRCIGVSLVAAPRVSNSLSPHATNSDPARQEWQLSLLA